MNTDNLDKFPADLRVKLHQAEQEALHTREMADEAITAVLSLKIMIDVLETMADGNRYQDPGKYGPVFYVLDPVGRQALPEEYVNENHPHRLRRGALVKLADARKVACPHCGRLQIETVKYHQTFDSPEGDTWVKEYFIVCEKCLKTWATREQETKDGRF